MLGVYARVLLDMYARGARARGIDGGRGGLVTVMQRAGGGLGSSSDHAFRQGHEMLAGSPA